VRQPIRVYLAGSSERSRCFLFSITYINGTPLPLTLYRTRRSRVRGAMDEEGSGRLGSVGMAWTVLQGSTVRESPHYARGTRRPCVCQSAQATFEPDQIVAGRAEGKARRRRRPEPGGGWEVAMSAFARPPSHLSPARPPHTTASAKKSPKARYSSRSSAASTHSNADSSRLSATPSSSSSRVASIALSMSVWRIHSWV